MSRSRLKEFRNSYEEDYVDNSDTKNDYYLRRKEKQMKNVIRSKNVDWLIEIEEGENY
jgi:hypothetical protein